jgi:hypothetical protein
MDGFRVSTLDDTIESQQITTIAEKVFYDHIHDVFGDEKLSNLVQLESLADSDKPNYLKMPDKASRIAESVVRYNISDDDTPDMREVKYLPPKDFLLHVNGRALDSTSEIVTDFSGYQFIVLNDQMPTYYTDFDDEYLVFDSYDVAVEDTLQGSKSGVLTKTERQWSATESYEIDLPDWYQPTYLNAVIAEVSFVLKEEPNGLAMKRARSGMIKARKKQRVGTPNKQRRNYGRWA